jgi:methylated-DNA-[protein]-cysteine S-methyltransferase
MSGDIAFDAVIDSPIGRLGLVMQGEALGRLIFLPGRPALLAPRRRAARRVASSIQAYFKDPSDAPEVACLLSGTPFQRKVWRTLRTIPAGQVVSYGALAHTLGTSARAIGGACRNNPVPLVVPCHRVVAKKGLGGFAGDRDGRLVAIKRKLLAHEGVEI